MSGNAEPIRRHSTPIAASVAAMALAVWGSVPHELQREAARLGSRAFNVVAANPADAVMHEEHNLVVEDSFVLNGKVDDLGWAGSCLLATWEGKLYRYNVERGELNAVPMSTTSHRDWVQLISGTTFGVAVEGKRGSPPVVPRPPLYHITPEVMNVVQCGLDNSLVTPSSFGTDWRVYVIGGAVTEGRSYFIEADDEAGAPFGGNKGCCLWPTLVAVALRSPSDPTRLAEIGLGSSPQYRGGDNYSTLDDVRGRGQQSRGRWCQL